MSSIEFMFLSKTSALTLSNDSILFIRRFQNLNSGWNTGVCSIVLTKLTSCSNSIYMKSLFQSQFHYIECGVDQFFLQIMNLSIKY
ncbi:hypothetical protein pb186bvf_013822 [Paramecium bursaria]